MHTQNKNSKTPTRGRGSRGPTRFPKAVEFARLRGRSYHHLWCCLVGKRGGTLAAEYHAWYAERQALNRKFAQGQTR